MLNFKHERNQKKCQEIGLLILLKVYIQPLGFILEFLDKLGLFLWVGVILLITV